MKSGDLIKIWMGVLFENSIVCHVFYAMALGAARDFWLCVVFGVCFVLVCLALWVFVFGGLGWAWSGFLDCCTDCCSGWLLCFVVWGWLGFCWFCLESLILAQDERWRRA